MYCRNCGAEIPDGSNYCPECGCSLSSSQNYYTPESRYPRNDKPSNYLILAILVTIFCCVPFGFIGIIYASKVESCWSSGYYDEAWESSRKARNWSIAGIVVNIVVWLAYIILILVGVSWATWWDSSSLYSI